MVRLTKELVLSIDDEAIMLSEDTARQLYVDLGEALGYDKAGADKPFTPQELPPEAL
jgi:hypothetical protein